MDKALLQQRYSFLSPHIAKEPYIYEILEEIASHQPAALKSDDGFATLELLKRSTNIKMPFNPSREKNIAYLLDLLVKHHGEIVKPLVTFDFALEPETKKLNLTERLEYTILLNNEEWGRNQEKRDKASAASLLEFLQKFRLFNLTKLLKKVKNRQHLSRIIKTELGINIFTFKHYQLDKNNEEVSEDYCFHQNNYAAVKNSLDIEEIKSIVQDHSAHVLRRLKKFGILNAEFSDYRDPKLEYILHVLNNDIPVTIQPNTIIDIKNFTSLRSCLAKVDKLIDPLLSLGNDMVNYVRECGMCDQSTLVAVFDGLTEDMVRKWAKDNLDKNRILSFVNLDGNTTLIDSHFFMNEISDLHKLILVEKERFASLSSPEKQKKSKEFEALCGLAQGLVEDQDRARKILDGQDKIETLQVILAESEENKKYENLQRTLQKRDSALQNGGSVLGSFFSFLKSLFGRKEKKGEAAQKIVVTVAPDVRNRPLSKKTQNIFEKLEQKNEKIIPMSNFIDLSPENAIQVDTVIDELRAHNLKIVVPIYNARKILYPKRSQKYLIPDIEYLIINYDVIQTQESIRDFTDSLDSEKLKDEPMSAQAVLAIEKYLLTLHRQKKAQLMREKMNRKEEDQKGS